jgi:DNA-binding MarR family transcriptional regulator
LTSVYMHTQNTGHMRRTAALNECNCFAVRQAARHVTRLYEHHLAGAELTSAQFSIIAALGEAGEMSMSQLARALVMERTTLLRAMKPLQRDDLVRSAPGADDTRQLVFSLSASGERKLREAVPLWAKAQEAFETRFGSRQAAQLRRSLLSLASGA